MTVVFGRIWLHLVVFGDLVILCHLSYFVIFCRILSYFVVFGLILSYLVVFQSILSYLVVFGRIWSQSTLGGPHQTQGTNFYNQTEPLLQLYTTETTTLHQRERKTNARLDIRASGLFQQNTDSLASSCIAGEWK